MNATFCYYIQVAAIDGGGVACVNAGVAELADAPGLGSGG